MKKFYIKIILSEWNFCINFADGLEAQVLPHLKII